MACQISIHNIYSGQMVWALCSKHPYWPSIVYPVDSQKVVQGDHPNQSVHVRFCASKWNGYWVKLENVFEFDGYESFVTKKHSMKSKLSEDDFNKAFETESDEAWRKAVIEATFVMNKDPNSRLIVFDTLNKSMSELKEIASSITFGDSNTEPKITEPFEQRSTRHPVRAKKPSNKISVKVEPLEETTQSSKTVQKGRRHLEPALGTKQSQQLVPGYSVQKQTFDDFVKDLLTYRIESQPKNRLFDNIPRDIICKICCSTRNDSDLFECPGCNDFAHIVCANNNKIPEREPNQRSTSSIIISIDYRLYCNKCPSSLICFACKEAPTTQLKKCNEKSCTRYYHKSCLVKWYQADSNFKCPLHVCHTCFSIKNDLKTMTTEFTYCVKCPTAYHIDSCCIPAGTIILTRKQHLCIRHHRCEEREELPSLDWCLRCGKEDDVLVRCGSCPKTYHMSCLNPSESPDPFLCESCINGRNPLYGETVLVKYQTYPWWPAVIVPDWEIPKNARDDQQNDQEFCVRLFADYHFRWIGRSSVCFYSKGEAKSDIGKSERDRALVEAANWFEKTDNLQIEKLDSNDNENSEIISLEKQRSNKNEIIKLEANGSQLSRQPLKYTKITKIHPVAPAKLPKSEDEPIVCSCKPNDDDPCGPTSNCENRRTQIECDAKLCPIGLNCKNQCFVRKISATVRVVFMGEKKGFGLIADESIYAGTLVIEFLGELINEDEFRRRRRITLSVPEARHYYFMTYIKNLYIDAERKGNESRFVNHSCDPNCQIQKWSVKRVIRFGYFALKDIDKGTEITINYGFAAGKIQQECLCGEKECKGVIQ